MRLKNFSASRKASIFGLIFRGLALLACLLTGSQSWAQSVPNWSSIGPAGGSIKTLLAYPAAPSISTIIYAGTDANGVFLSTDAGTTWHSANTGIKVNSSTGLRHIYVMAILGQYVYAATDSGVYVTSAGGTPAWSLVAQPTTGVVQYLVSANSTLYMAVPYESSVYSTTLAGIDAPAWTSLPLPSDTVNALGVLNGNIAVGSLSAIYLLDRTGTPIWINSELDLPSPFFEAEQVTALVSTSSKWAFACTLGGKVFQSSDLSPGSHTVWTKLFVTTFSNPPDSCLGLSMARVNAQNQSVLVMSTNSGGFVSTVFDDTSSDAPTMQPGPVFPMTTSVNASLQMDAAGLSNVLWATEFGLYGFSTTDLSLGATTITSLPTVLNGPLKLTAPSQRLDNVNVQDIAAIGSSLYAIAKSDGSYMDVMSSTDGGASWTPTQLTPTIDAFSINSLAVDTIRKVLYAGTSNGVFYLQQGVSNWAPLGNPFFVRAMAVGAQALYSISKGTPSSSLVVQSLVGAATPFATFEEKTGPFVNFDVRALVVSGGSVYAGGSALNTSYDNSVWVALDVVSGSPIVWKNFGNGSFINESTLDSIAVAAGHLFAGGDGFLMKCDNSAASWGSIAGLSSTFITVTLASDDQTLFVGTKGQGLMALNLRSNTESLVSISGSGATGLPSTVVNNLRVIDGRLYVATTAGISTPAIVPSSVANSDTGGGGCSIATAGKPDPLLWLMVAIAALQIVISRKRRMRKLDSSIHLQYDAVEG